MTQASIAPIRKCALLTRVSTTMQSRVEEGSLKNQLERLRAHIAYRNANYDERWVEINTYEMKAVSGKDALRSKEFQRLFEDIRVQTGENNPPPGPRRDARAGGEEGRRE